MSAAEANFELQAVDSDIREFYTRHYETHYSPKLPILIQLSRLLRGLLEQAPYGEKGAGDGEGAKDDIQPQKLVAETGGGALVAVDGLTELLREHGAKGTFDLFVEFAAGLRMLAERVDDRAGSFVQIAADGIGFAHAASAAGDGETVKAQDKAVPPYAPSLKMAIARAHKLARESGDGFVGPQHLLMALGSIWERCRMATSTGEDRV